MPEWLKKKRSFTHFEPITESEWELWFICVPQGDSWICFLTSRKHTVQLFYTDGMPWFYYAFTSTNKTNVWSLDAVWYRIWKLMNWNFLPTTLFHPSCICKTRTVAASESGLLPNLLVMGYKITRHFEVTWNVFVVALGRVSLCDESCIGSNQVPWPCLRTHRMLPSLQHLLLPQ